MDLRRALSVIGFSILLVGCQPKAQPAASTAPAPAPSARPQTLYQRLGGYDALAAVTDDFVGRLLGNSATARYFANTDDTGKKRVRQMVVDQLCAATGGPCIYVGADMKLAHKDLGITEKDWNTAVGMLVATLDKFTVPAKEKNEVLTIVGSVKADVVGQ